MLGVSDISVHFPKGALVTSLVVQWLRLHASTAGGTGSIPGQGAKIPHPTCRAAKKKKKRVKGALVHHLSIPPPLPLRTCA